MKNRNLIKIADTSFKNAMRIAELFDKFVFVIFPDKFVLIPAQEIRICNKF